MAGRSGRRGRITRSADFDRVYRSGRSHANRMLVLHTFPRGDSEPSRLGLSVSRKVGGAVERNRIKRLLREAFDACSAGIQPGFDVVAVARADISDLAERSGLAAVTELMQDLIAEAGIALGDGE